MVKKDLFNFSIAKTIDGWGPLSAFWKIYNVVAIVGLKRDLKHFLLLRAVLMT